MRIGGLRSKRVRRGRQLLTASCTSDRIVSRSLAYRPRIDRPFLCRRCATSCHGSPADLSQQFGVRFREESALSAEKSSSSPSLKATSSEAQTHTVAIVESLRVQFIGDAEADRTLPAHDAAIRARRDRCTGLFRVCGILNFCATEHTLAPEYRRAHCRRTVDW